MSRLELRRCAGSWGGFKGARATISSDSAGADPKIASGTTAWPIGASRRPWLETTAGGTLESGNWVSDTQQLPQARTPLLAQ